MKRMVYLMYNIIKIPLECFLKPVIKLLVYCALGIVEPDGVIRIGEYMHVVIPDVCQVQLIYKFKSVLNMNIVIGRTVHEEQTVYIPE